MFHVKHFYTKKTQKYKYVQKYTYNFCQNLYNINVSRETNLCYTYLNK